MLSTLLTQLQQQPSQVSFQQVQQVINQHYHYTPTAFYNGDIENLAGTNEGSCKIFAFAQLQQLSQEQTLACFGSYYQDDVLAKPAGDDHANIRNFMRNGWQGLHFNGPALIAK